MTSCSDWVAVGRFGRPHGIKGLITVISFTNPRDNIVEYAQWYANVNQHWHPLKLQHTELTHKSILVRVDGYITREEVASLTNIDIAIKREELPALPEGEFYWHQLIGLHVFNKDGSTLGTVAEIMATGANDVLVVTGEKRHLIPYLLGSYVLDIDIKNQRLTVDWDVDF